MFQQLLALVIIIFFIVRLYVQKRKKKISANEFIFWLFFWLLAGGAIVFLKEIDELSNYLGFSSKGIDILLYVGFVAMIYLIFKLRLKVEKLDNNITKIVQEIALKNKK